MRKLFIILAMLVLCRVALAEEFVYVTNMGDNTVSVVNVSSNTVVDTIPVCAQPVFVLGDDSGLFVYVSCSGNSTIDVIDTTLNQVTSNINIPGGVWVIQNNPLWSEVFITSLGVRTSVLRMNDLIIDRDIDETFSSTSVAFSPDGTVAYITDFSSRFVRVINNVTNTLLRSIDVGSPSFGIQVHPISGIIYIATTDGLRVEHPTQGLLDTIILAGDPTGVLLSSDGNTLYVVDSSRTISKIDTRNLNISATADVGFSPQGIAVNSDETKVYVANSGSSTMTVLDDQLNITTVVNVGNNPIVPAVVDVRTTRRASLVVNLQSDNDMDGVPNQTDKCPQSDDKVVDTLGCNITEFCSKFDATTHNGRNICKNADFNNDEPVFEKNERDCMVYKPTRKKTDNLCVPAE